LLEFDYFGEDEDVLNSLLERELAPVVQNGNTSARGREQSAPSTTGTKKESSFNLQLRKFSNKLNFTRACEVHRWRQNNLLKVDVERSKVAEKNSNSNNNNNNAATTTSANKKLKKKLKEKKKKPEISSATSPPVSSPSLSSTTTGGNPYETFYASYFSSPSSSSFESNNNNNVLKHIFSLLNQDGGGTLSLYEFKKGATDVLGVKIDRKILEPYFPIRRSSEQQNNEQQKENNNNKIDFRAFQEGVVEYDTFEKICSEWMEREEATKGVLNRKYSSFS